MPPPSIFSPEREFKLDRDDIFSVMEIEIDRNTMASTVRTPGVKAHGMIQEKYRELVRPKRLHRKTMVTVANPKKVL